MLAVIVAAVGWGVYKEPAIVGSLATAAGAVGALVFQRNRENRREVAQRHREQLAPLYDSLFRRFKDGFDLDSSDDREFVFELQRKLIFFGSTSVIKAWLLYLRSSSDADDDLSATLNLLAWERVLLAIRDDFGHDSSDLQPGDLLRVYIHDMDEVLALVADDGESSGSR